MKIVNRLFESFNQGVAAVTTLFHEDAVIEFPYATSLGTASRLTLPEYSNYLKGALPNMPDIHFDIRGIYPVGENACWAEIHGEAVIPKTGKLYRQDYVVYLVQKEGRIYQYREYWDPIAGLKAFGTNESMTEIFNTNEK